MIESIRHWIELQIPRDHIFYILFGTIEGGITYSLDNRNHKIWDKQYLNLKGGGIIICQINITRPSIKQGRNNERISLNHNDIQGLNNERANFNPMTYDGLAANFEYLTQKCHTQLTRRLK